MPIYEYCCGKCGKTTEVYQNFSEMKPPICCGEGMNWIPSMPSMIRIKGTHSKGYKEGYAKDYRRRREDKGFVSTSKS